MNAFNSKELGDFLRSRRSRLSPEALGLPIGRRRRTPGLRREEVAQLAGIGVDWYIRLEQGRSVTPSAMTVDSLARALQLNSVEHAHLRALTHTVEHRPWQREIVPHGLRRTVEALNLPSYITGRRWDVLAWNAAADEIFAFSRIAEDERNTLIQTLNNPKARGLFGSGWRDEARRMVAQFRATYDLWANDPAFVDLVDRLRSGCPEFASWWSAHDLRGTKAGRKELTHPRKGRLDLQYTNFQANDDPDLKLTIYAEDIVRAR